MFKPIDQVQRQYTYPIQAIKLFETKKSQIAKKNNLNFLNLINKSEYNLFHPNIKNSEIGTKLDLNM